jgi:5-methyltetrahydrofolate--homocysteine methyltransferase
MDDKARILQELCDAVVNLDFTQIKDIADKALAAGIPPGEAISNGLGKGMEIVGKKFEAGEYFLSELIMAGETMKTALQVIEPHLKADKTAKAGVVAIGTVAGDIHDIGKNIVIAMLRSASLVVHDLGVDLSAETFVQKVKEKKPDVLGMSALLLSTMPGMKVVVEALKKEGLRDKVKVIIGGRPVTQEYADEIGADAYAKDAIEAVDKVQALL